MKMQKVFVLLPLLICFSTVLGQNEFRTVIKDSDTKEPLAGANAILKAMTALKKEDFSVKPIQEFHSQS